MVNIPQRFADGGFLEDIYLIGYSHGYGVAHNNVPRLGQEYLTESEGRLVATRENIRDVHQALTFEALQHSRCYSPFEEIAKELNDFGDGGFFIIADGEEPIGPFDSVAEAEREADDLGLENYEIEERPSSDEAWEAFEEGEQAAVYDDLSRYKDSDYGIDDDLKA